eukprot:15504-Prorocentrum_minimum.AAC.3
MRSLAKVARSTWALGRGRRPITHWLPVRTHSVCGLLLSAMPGRYSPYHICELPVVRGNTSTESGPQTPGFLVLLLLTVRPSSAGAGEERLDYKQAQLESWRKLRNNGLNVLKPTPEAGTDFRSDTVSSAELAGLAAGPYCTLRALSRVLVLSPFSLDALCGAWPAVRAGNPILSVHRH